MAAYLLARIVEDDQVSQAALKLDHIVRRDSTREIAKSAAQRRAVELCLEVLALGDGGAIDLAEEVLQYLVRAYADRPDFPPEWLPEVPW